MQAAATSGRLGEQERQRHGEENAPAEPLPDVAASGVAELVGGDELDRPVAQVRPEQRVPEDHDRGRPEPRCLAVDRRRLVADLVDTNLRVGHALALLETRDGRRHRRVVNGMRPDRSEQGADDDEDGTDRDEDRCDDRPPAPRKLARQRHHDAEHDGDGRRPRENSIPLAQYVAPVLLLRDPVAPVPPEADEADRQGRDRDEQVHGDADHDSGADLAEGKAPRDPAAEHREQTEDGKLDGNAEQEEQPPHRAVPRRPMQLGSGEVRRGVESRSV